MKIDDPAETVEIVHHKKPAAGGDNAAVDVVLQPVGCLLLDPAEGGLALLGEKSSNLGFQKGFDQVVGIKREPAGRRRQCPRRSSFPHPHEPDQDNIIGHVVRLFLVLMNS